MSASTERPRVVLVEDDPSVRRFVEMALEELPIELVSCADVAQARAALRLQRAALVITDLMLPGESGLSLIESLTNDPALRAGARIAVFSAGVSAAVQSQLDALAVWRVLSKPVSLAMLEACVQDAVSGVDDDRSHLAPRPIPDQDAASDVVARHFEGDRELFEAYREACRRQFGADIEEGDRAERMADWPRLERLAHSLKTVLHTLGHAEEGDLARKLEGNARDAHAARARNGWEALRGALSKVIASEEDADLGAGDPP